MGRRDLRHERQVRGRRLHEPEHPLWGWGDSDVASFDVRVLDANGTPSAPATITYAAAPERVDVGEGDACDVGNYPARCTGDFVCSDDGAGGTECATAEAPVFDSLTVNRLPDGDIEIVGSGTDANFDARRFRATVTFDDESTWDSPNLNFFTNPDQNTTWDGTRFTANRRFTATSGEATPVEVEVFVRDNENLDSGTLTGAIPAPPAFVDLVAGDACDPVDESFSACAEGLACSPDLVTGGHSCAANRAPQLFDATLWQDTPENAGFVFDGADLDGNLDRWEMLFWGPNGKVGKGGPVRLGLLPNPEGLAFFQTEGLLEDFALSNFQMVQVQLEDSEGEKSAWLTVPLAAILNAGEACAPADPSTVCDPLAGLACGTSNVCETAEAPTVTSVVAHRIDETTITLDIEGADVNADAYDLVYTYILDGEANEYVSAYRQVPVEIIGEETFSFTYEQEYWEYADAEVFEVEVAFIDLTGRTGAATRVTIPEIIEEGGTCSGDDTMDRCATGTGCDNGTCVAHPPTVDGVEATFVDNGRTLEVTVTGVDADLDVTGFELAFTGGASDLTVDSVVDGNAYRDLVPEMTWDGTAYTAVHRFEGWGLEDERDHDLLTVTAEDAYENTASSMTALLPTQLFDEVCDVDGTDDRCGPGLTCDGTDEVCVNDDADVCAGLPTSNLSEVGTGDGNGGMSWSYAIGGISGATNLFEEGCEFSSGARGDERVFRWMAPITGTVDAVLTVTAGTVHFHYAADTCADPAGTDDCVQRNAYTHTIDVVQDQEVFFLLDCANFSASCTGSVDITYQP